MGKTQSKEEVIIAQTASGGNNSADVEQIKYHASTTNVVLLVILTLLLLGFLYLVFKIYKNCHTKWMANEINRHALRRSISYFRRNPKINEEAV